MGNLEVTRLQQGLLRATEEVKEIQAIWTVVLTFPEEPDVMVKLHEGINQFKNLIKGIEGSDPHFKGFRDKFVLQIERLANSLDLTARSRRGLLPFLGDIGKSLFGLSTEKDIEQLKDAIKDNRRYTSAVRHDTEKLLSVINITRAEEVENRRVIGDIRNATLNMEKEIMEVWKKMDDSLLTIHITREIHRQYEQIQDMVSIVKDRRNTFLGARRDLESGKLSEVLLPIKELRKLAKKDNLPQGSSFIEPLMWYYYKLPVQVLSYGSSVLYVVKLPLVSNKVFCTLIPYLIL